MEITESEPQKPDGRTRSGKARMDRLSAEERKALASKASKVRWNKTQELTADPDEIVPAGNLPEAKYKGFLNLLGVDLPCYVLENGQRVVGRTSFTEMLTGIKAGGGLEKYLGVEP